MADCYLQLGWTSIIIAARTLHYTSFRTGRSREQGTCSITCLWVVFIRLFRKFRSFQIHLSLRSRKHFPCFKTRVGDWPKTRNCCESASTRVFPLLFCFGKTRTNALYLLNNQIRINQSRRAFISSVETRKKSSPFL